MKYLAILLFMFATHLVSAEPLRIMAIGESTSLGYYDGIEHSEASIPLMVKQEVESFGIQVILENKSVSSTTAEWHLANNSFSESKSNIVMIQLGINDAVKTDVCKFIDDFTLLIDALQRAGKIVYITMPNKIAGALSTQLEYYAYKMQSLGINKGVIVVNQGAQDIPLSDTYHPTHVGYLSLGSALKDRVSTDAPSIIAYIQATRVYIAMLNRSPEKNGLDYWANEILRYDLVSVVQRFIDFFNIGSDSDFLDLVYLNLMDRYPDAEGKTYWINCIANSGRGRALIMIMEILAKDSGIDGLVFQNKIFAGLAYGYIYKKADVAENNNLSTITEDSVSILIFTQNL